uniref:hypothetical protein n=1 Tax=Rhodoblastus sp. TaxID=1962975 RepID=UPI003F9CD49D
IKLGYKIEGESQFKAATRQAVIEAKVLADVLEAGAKAFANMLVKAAQGLDQMFYASSRIGASVKNIQAVEYAASQLGSTVEASHSSLEAFGNFLRSQPGAKKFIENLGVSLKDANGHIKDTAELFLGVIDKIKSQPYAQQKKYWEIFGIDENTWRALSDPNAKGFLNEKNSIFKRLGLDPDQAAKDGRSFMQAMRGVGAALDGILQKVMANFLGDGNNGIKALQEFLAEHGRTIADAIVSIVRAFVDLAREILGFNNQDDPDKAIRQIGEGIENTAKATQLFIKQIREMFAWLEKFNEDSKDWWITKLLNGTLNASQSAGMAMHDSRLAGDPDAASQGGWGDSIRRAWSNRPKWMGGNGGGSGTQVAEPGAPGQYRPVYKVGDKDLSDAVVNTIAGEARLGDPASVDAVIHNMFNRLGTKAYGPSGNLEEVARAPNQYAGYRRATPEQAKMIRDRIRAIASGAVKDITNGANEYRAGSYMGPWGQKHANSPVIGGNRFAYNPAGGVGPYAPYADPKDAGGKTFAQKLHDDFGPGGRWSVIGSANAAEAPRPLAPHGMIGLRGALGADGAKPGGITNNNNAAVTQTVTNNINGFSDPHSVASAVANSQAKTNRTLGDLIRNTQGAAQ